MPNHTTNFVTIGTNTNVDEEILALQELKTDLLIRHNEFDFEGIIPMPDYIYRGSIGDREQKKYGSLNWYDWSVANWGTKWNSYDVEVLQDDESILYVCFLTAWDAPRGIANRIKEYCDKYNLYLDWDAEHEFEDGIEKIA